MKDKIKEIGKLYTKSLKKGMDEVTIEMQQKRIKELEQINEEHRKINGELRKTINEAIEYLTSYDSINELIRYETSKDNKGLDRKTMIEMDRRYAIIHHKLLNILQGSDE